MRAVVPPFDTSPAPGVASPLDGAVVGLAVDAEVVAVVAGVVAVVAVVAGVVGVVVAAATVVGA